MRGEIGGEDQGSEGGDGENVTKIIDTHVKKQMNELSIKMQTYCDRKLRECMIEYFEIQFEYGGGSLTWIIK